MIYFEAFRIIMFMFQLWSIRTLKYYIHKIKLNPGTSCIGCLLAARLLTAQVPASEFYSFDQNKYKDGK